MAKKLLLVDDSRTVQTMVRMTFAAEDFIIGTVDNAEEAIRKVAELRPDIVVADLSLPGKNGYDVCKALKSTARFSTIPVLLLHGSAARIDPRRAQEVGVDGELQKPFETQALIDLVKTLCSSGREKAPAPVRRVEEEVVVGDDIIIDAADLAMSERPEPEPPPVEKPPVRDLGPALKGPPGPPPRPGPRLSTPTLRNGSPRPEGVRPSGPPPPALPQTGLVSRPGPAPRTTPSGLPEIPSRPQTIGLMPDPSPSLAPPAQGPDPEMEIVIEAEVPEAVEGPGELPSFDGFDLIPPSTAIVESIARPEATTARGFVRPAEPAQAPEAEPSDLSASGAIDPAAYAAIVKLSREIIERVAWEVVPDLADRIIREELDRLVQKPPK